MLRLKCTEVWGGIKNQDVDVCSPGLNVSLYSSSCNGGRGGDVYYFSLCSADRVTRVALADVVGHGEDVSQVSQWVYEEMAARLDEWDLPGMMAALNGRVLRKGPDALTTAVVLSYYRDLRQVYFVYAGHPPVLLRSVDGRWRDLAVAQSEKVQNLPFGVADDVPYTVSDAQLAESEVMLVYSDGVIEAPSPDGVQFGVDRLRDVLRETHDGDMWELKRRVIDRLRDWTGGSLDHDDVTLLAIQLSEQAAAETG